MINGTSGIDIRQTLASELLAFGFKLYPGSQSLFDDPTLGAIKARSKLVNLLGKVDGKYER
jgi:hypothetical protein